MGMITVTEAESFKRCGWQHEFNSMSRMGLESANPLQSLYTGTLWHRALDALAQKESIKEPHKFQGHSLQDLCEICYYNAYAHTPDPFLIISGELTDKTREHYVKVTGRSITQFEMKPTFDTIALVKQMLINYRQYYSGRLIPEGWEYVQTEQQFFKVLPDTEHCSCYKKAKCVCTNVPKNKKSCRYNKHTYYVYCRCIENPTCLCRESHLLEGRLDGVIRHVATGKIAVLENKTFSVHPNEKELIRTPQFMGYMWIGQDLGVEEVLYNGAWTRTSVPDGYNKEAGRKWNNDDLFVRKVLTFSQAELNEWACQMATTALAAYDPHYVPTRNVHPVGGCNGVNNCSYKTLCDARFAHSPFYNAILRNEYRRRDDSEHTLSEVSQ